MPVGQADLDNAVREGWIRDEDNEISIDGYSATIQVSTLDGTSGVYLKNSIGAVSFSAGSSGDGYFANRLGVGTVNPETTLEVIGKTRTDELQVTTNVVAGYVLTSDANGNATWEPTGAASSGVSEITFQENKTAQEEINDTILASLDGYVANITFEENKGTQEEINDTILNSLDGYAIRAIEDQRWIDSSQQLQDLRDSLDGYVINSTFEENKGAQEEINYHVLVALDGYVVNSTFEENKGAQEEINDTILTSLDGYAIRAIEDQRWIDSSQQLQDLRDSLDGYVVNLTFEENKNAQEEINNQILISLDGYASKITEAEHYTQLSQAIQDIVGVIDGYSTDAEFAGLSNTVTENNNAQQQINQTILKDLDGYETKISAQDNYDAIGAAINTIRKDLEDAYADISGSAADGYIAFFTGPTSIAGDNDLYFDRVNNQLQVSALKLTTVPADGYVLTSDSDGNATWKLSPGAHDVHRAHDQLVHTIAEDSFEEYTYTGAFVTNITIWNDSTKTIKIREEQFTYSGSFVSQVITIQYNGAGIETERTTELYTYSGSFVSNITRTLT